MFEILKTKLEILLTVFVLFQAHALYIKHHKIEAMKQAEAKAAVQTLQKNKIARLENSTTDIPTDIPAEIAEHMTTEIDMNTIDLQTDSMTKEQAIQLINSIPE